MGTCATSCGPWQPLGTPANTGRHRVLTRVLPCRTRQGGAELGADAGADAAAGAALQAQSECGAVSARSRGAGRRGAPGHLLRARLAWEAWEPMGRSGPAARGCPEREAWISAAGIRRSTRPPWSS